MLSSRGQRFFFVRMPLLVSTAIVAILLAAASQHWSEPRTIVIALIIAVIWAAFVVCPLLILIAPAKSK